MALAIALIGGWEIRFPNICSQSLSPELPFGDGKTGMIALNEWMASGTQLAHLSVRAWAIVLKKAG